MFREISVNRQSGFTLVELLIVAIILAILAAIIVPQFASTTVDAQESALRSNITSMRAAVDLYRQQHTVYPGKNASSTGACTGVKGTGLVDSEQAVIDQLTRYSNSTGGTCNLPEAGYDFGPYIQDDDLPENPITGVKTVAIETSGNLVMSAAAAAGWKLDVLSGKMIVNDSNTDSQGDAYSTY